MIHSITVHAGVAAINLDAAFGGNRWIAWAAAGPLRETEARTPEIALSKYEKLRRRIK